MVRTDDDNPRDQHAQGGVDALRGAIRIIETATDVGIRARVGSLETRAVIDLVADALLRGDDSVKVFGELAARAARQADGNRA